MKLNVGCGTDYREDFINIDGSNKLPNVDRVIDISKDSLLNHFKKGQIEFILANDIIEHHFHWEAVEILKDFHTLLIPEGRLELRVPDGEYIIKSWRIPLEKKIYLLFGGQDMSQGGELAMEESRKKFPEYFCHKFCWTRKQMKVELEKIGYSQIRFKRAKTNFIVYAVKQA